MGKGKRDVVFWSVVGFLVGLGLSGLLGSTIAWVAVAKRQEQLLADLTPTQAVVVTEALVPGEPVKAAQLALRQVPGLLVSPNTVLPDEVDGLAGKAPSVAFFPGDLLLRSAFGLPPREAAAAAAPSSP
jgi:flagella basal body P-ring formation protein FlgA